jgi:hypothetical protein
MCYGPYWRALALAAACALLLVASTCVAQVDRFPFWRIGRLSGDALGCLIGQKEDAIELMACREVCAPIPWQLDERDEAGELALGDGPEPTRDAPSGIVDSNDEVLWMAADGGRQIEPSAIPPGTTCGVQIESRTGSDHWWVYAIVVPPPAPRSPVRYVSYHPARDVVETARVAIGFGAPTPRYLALRTDDGSFAANQLDRLKIRASARFLGVVPLGRDEDDIQWLYDAWKVGPIRVARRERQWVRLGWGLRTPIFRTESFVYRDFVELPVRLRLNFPPAYFFRGIEVQAALDFRDLRGWTVRTPAGRAGAVGAIDEETTERLNDLDADWLALDGPDATVVLRLVLGESFASLRRQLLYRENDGGYEPESDRGERPAIGFSLTEWGEVDRGHHWFAAVATALRAGYDVDNFLRLDAMPVEIEVRPLPEAPKVDSRVKSGQ